MSTEESSSVSKKTGKILPTFKVSRKVLNILKLGSICIRNKKKDNALSTQVVCEKTTDE